MMEGTMHLMLGNGELDGGDPRDPRLGAPKGGREGLTVFFFRPIRPIRRFGGDIGSWVSPHSFQFCFLRARVYI